MSDMNKFNSLDSNTVTRINKDGSTFTQPIEEFLEDYGNPLEPNRILRQLKDGLKDD
jgi:hypothetical protein